MDTLRYDMTLLAQRYELGPVLGSGGMARVHEATDRVLGRRVAVKLLRRELAPDPPARARLLTEARAAASLTHPNAVAVYDAGEEAGEPFIVMEYVAGHSLAEVLAQRGALPVPEARHHAAGVLAALAAAHLRGLVHRDVKPGNVLLSESGEVKLADFGIAKGLGEATASLTATGQVLGTPRYLAPERASGGSATPRSDIYAVGVLLYEMLAGRPPFHGDRAVSVALAHQHTPVPRLDARQPSVPARLADVVHRALAKDPADRFPTAEAMLEALAGPDGEGMTPTAAPVAARAGDVEGLDADTGPGAVVDPAPTAPAERLTPRRRVPLLAGALLAVAAVLGLTAIGTGSQSSPSQEAAGADGGAEPAASPSEAEPTATPGETATAVLEPVSDDLPPAEALAVFAAALASDPGSAGEKGEDLVADVWEVLGEQGEERREDALELMGEIQEWVAEGKLDREVGQRALELLEAVAGESEGGTGGGEGDDDRDEGEGEGGGGDGDKDKDKDKDKDDGSGRGPDGEGPPGQRGRGRGG